MISLRKLVLQNFWKSSKCFATFSERETHFREHFDGKIISHYAQHISKYQGYHIPNHLKKIELTSDEKLEKLFDTGGNLNISDLPKIIHQLQQFDQPSNEFITTINSLDDYFSKIIQKIDSQDLLTILDSFMQVIPSKITKLNCFQLIISRLTQTQSKTDDFMRICFYVGLWKKKTDAKNILTKLFDKDLDSFLNTKLSSLDFAIICNSSFKSSVPIRNLKFKQRLVLEVIQTDLDPLTFLTFIKSLRHNRIKAEEIIEAVRNLVHSNKFDRVSLCEIVHVLALLADNLVKDDEMTTYFVRKVLQLLELEQNVREKDIATFLWCCSHLDLEIGEGDLQKIVNIILLKVQNKDYQRKFDELVDSVLSLWILNMKSIELLEVTTKNQQFLILNDRNRIKLESRKKLLLTCASIETPDANELSVAYAFRKTFKAPNFLLEKRPELKYVMSCLKGFNIMCVQQINHLNIAGIFVEDINLHVEVLDKSNTLNDRCTPIGIMKLKLRLLEQMGCRVLMIDSRQASIKITSLVKEFR